MYNMSAIKANILLKNPFFGAILLNMKVVETDEIPVAATDGKHLFINYDGVKRLESYLGKDAIFSVVTHELAHVALRHVCDEVFTSRIKEKRMIFATEYAANNLVYMSGYPTAEQGMIFSTNYLNDSTLGIYNKLEDEQEENDSGGEQLDTHDKWGTQKKQEIEHIVKQAAVIAKQTYGNLPVGIQRLIDEILEPTLPWDALIRSWVKSSLWGGESRRDYKRFSKRHMHRDLYLPSRNPSAQEIVVAIDASGSIDNDDLKEVLSEVNGVANGNRVILYSFDVDAYYLGEYNGSIPAIQGGGGTSLEDLLSKVAKEHSTAAALIIFTDGYVDLNVVPKYADVIPDTLFVLTKRTSVSPETVYSATGCRAVKIKR